MFDFVAKHKRLLQVVLVLIAIPFAFFGLEAYTRAVGGRDEVASVAGEPIARRELEAALRERQEALRQIFGRDFDPAAVDTPAERRELLESLIAERVLAREVARAWMVLPREAAIAEVTRMPEFQEDGRFAPERYAAYLRARGISDEHNVEQLRVRLPMARLVTAVANTAIQPRTLAERLLALEGERREVSEAFFAADAYAQKLQFDEAALRAYYDANLAEFREPERVRVEYAVLSVEALARAETVSDAELKKAYDERLAAGRLGAPEQRRASHILLKSKEEAEAIALEARKHPQRFAELARKHSQDAGSAQRGGDLGFFGPGDMVKEFAAAVFAMKPGEIAGPVQSEFGWHVVRLEAVQPGRTRSFEEAREELRGEIARQRAQRRFVESAEAFSNLVYEQSDSLKPAAERFGLTLQTSGWIAKGTPADGHLGHPKLAAALFSADAVQHRRNTDAVEVAPGTLVAARVVEHQPAAQKKFEEVREEVERRLRRREAAAAARKEAEATLEKLKAGEEARVNWGRTLVVSRRATGGLGAEAVARLMAVDAAKLPAYVGVDRGERGYAIYRVQKVLASEPLAAEEKANALQRFEREAGAADLQAWVAALRERTKVEIRAAALEKKP
ncbi:MAG: SurA N-terminal domain-containing protein [Burkholderiales bacterium]|nr:SurA N-terminal domain-containing protein [Burkholderiales bacterium]